MSLPPLMRDRCTISPQVSLGQRSALLHSNVYGYWTISPYNSNQYGAGERDVSSDSRRFWSGKDASSNSRCPPHPGETAQATGTGDHCLLLRGRVVWERTLGGSIQPTSRVATSRQKGKVVQGGKQFRHQDGRHGATRLQGRPTPSHREWRVASGSTVGKHSFGLLPVSCQGYCSSPRDFMVWWQLNSGHRSQLRCVCGVAGEQHWGARDECSSPRPPLRIQTIFSGRRQSRPLLFWVVQQKNDGESHGLRANVAVVTPDVPSWRYSLPSLERELLL